MRQLISAVFHVFVIHMFLFTGTAIANTLSDTYYQAFVNPYGFDGNLNDSVVLEPDYYSRFENCSQLTIELLNRSENQERQNLTTCPNNAQCTQIAKNIQSIIGLRLNVRNLGTFVRATESNPQLKFLDSEIGHATLTVYNINRNLGVDIRRVPEFVMQIGILSGVPCQ